jgi:hypothetical protein
MVATSFYEGNDPDAFVGAMLDRFGFDPSENNPDWGRAEDPINRYGFYCPARLLDQIYGGPYPMGS